MDSNYAQRIKAAWSESRTYGKLFPILDDLITPSAVREFLEGYVEVMKEIIVEEKIGKGDDRGFGRIEEMLNSSEITIGDAARDLAGDNLPLLRNLYEANTMQRIHGSWDKLLDKICPKVDPAHYISQK